MSREVCRQGFPTTSYGCGRHLVNGEADPHPMNMLYIMYGARENEEGELLPQLCDPELLAKKPIKPNSTQESPNHFLRR